jgi:hypothetical protein
MKNIIRSFIPLFIAVLLSGCVSESALHPEITKPEEQLLQGMGYDRDSPTSRRDLKMAFYWYHKAAVQGFSPAQNSLGSVYQEIRNYPAAATWYEASARQNNIEAVNNLAALYDAGLGVKQDQVLAAKLYEAAANAGYVYAIVNIGLSYQKGEGVVEDNVVADKWFNLIKLGIVKSSPPLILRSNRMSDALEKKMSKEQIAESSRLAYAWTRSVQNFESLIP